MYNRYRILLKFRIKNDFVIFTDTKTFNDFKPDSFVYLRRIFGTLHMAVSICNIHLILIATLTSIHNA